MQQILITMDPQGRLNVQQTNVPNKVQFYGMLELAREAYLKQQLTPQPRPKVVGVQGDVRIPRFPGNGG